MGPRLFFQRVPEGKVVKNRLYLDVRVSSRHRGYGLGPIFVHTVRMPGLGAAPQTRRLFPSQD